MTVTLLATLVPHSPTVLLYKILGTSLRAARHLGSTSCCCMTVTLLATLVHLQPYSIIYIFLMYIMLRPTLHLAVGTLSNTSRRVLRTSFVWRLHLCLLEGQCGVLTMFVRPPC